MKKIIIAFAFCLGAIQVLPAQNSGPSFTIKELDAMNKLELANIYVLQMKRFTQLMPFIAFNQFSSETESDLGIPKTTFNMQALSRVDSLVTGFNDGMEKDLPNIIPFSDKERIINAILFLQRNIEVVENGMK
jgi:hypothetical protein